MTRMVAGVEVGNTKTCAICDAKYTPLRGGYRGQDGRMIMEFDPIPICYKCGRGASVKKSHMPRQWRIFPDAFGGFTIPEVVQYGPVMAAARATIHLMEKEIERQEIENASGVPR